MFEKMRENPMYLTDPPILIEYSEEDFFEEDYEEQYNIVFGNIIEGNREFLDYEENCIKQIILQEQREEL